MDKADTRNHCKNGLYEETRDEAFTKPVSAAIVDGKRVLQHILIAEIVEPIAIALGRKQLNQIKEIAQSATLVMGKGDEHALFACGHGFGPTKREAAERVPAAKKFLQEFQADRLGGILKDRKTIFWIVPQSPAIGEAVGAATVELGRLPTGHRSIQKDQLTKCELEVENTPITLHID